MRISTVAALAGLLAAFDASAQTLLFPKLISYREHFTQSAPLGQADFAKEADAHARAASLRKLQENGPFELRVWRTDVMTGEGIGYVLAQGRMKTFRTLPGLHGRERAVLLANRTIRPTLLPVQELRALKGVSGQWTSCGVADGERVLIEASLDGVPVQAIADNPTACSNASTIGITALLQAVDTLGDHLGVQASMTSSE